MATSCEDYFYSFSILWEVYELFDTISCIPEGRQQWPESLFETYVQNERKLAKISQQMQWEEIKQNGKESKSNICFASRGILVSDDHETCHSNG